MASAASVLQDIPGLSATQISRNVLVHLARMKGDVSMESTATLVSAELGLPERDVKPTSMSVQAPLVATEVSVLIL